MSTTSTKFKQQTSQGSCFCSTQYQDLADVQFTSNVQNGVPSFGRMPEVTSLIDALINDSLNEV